MIARGEFRHHAAEARMACGLRKHAANPRPDRRRKPTRKRFRRRRSRSPKPARRRPFFNYSAARKAVRGAPKPPFAARDKIAANRQQPRHQCPRPPNPRRARRKSPAKRAKPKSKSPSPSTGAGRAKIDTGVAFFDHLLDQIARHGKIDLTLKARGDLAVDAHHTIEDCGIVFGQALARALGDKAGIARFGFAYAPLDESLSRARRRFFRTRLAFFSRPLDARNGRRLRFPDLAREFFRALAAAAGATLHLDVAARRQRPPPNRIAF